MLLVQKSFAEMAGTFIILFIGGGSILLSEKNLIPFFYVPIVWGLVICLMIALLGGISGAHFNPAVTLAFAAAKRFPLDWVFIYWVSQLTGGVAAMGLLAALKKI